MTSGGDDDPSRSDTKSGYRKQTVERDISAVENRTLLCNTSQQRSADGFSLRTWRTARKPRIWTPAATQQTIANIHFANEGVDAPTTDGMYEHSEAAGTTLGLTIGGSNGQDSRRYTKNELLKQRGVDSSVDDRDCAATVVSRLHGVRFRKGDA